MRRCGFEVDGKAWEIQIETPAKGNPRIVLKREGLHRGTFVEYARMLWLGDRLASAAVQQVPRAVLAEVLHCCRTELAS